MSGSIPSRRPSRAFTVALSSAALVLGASQITPAGAAVASGDLMANGTFVATAASWAPSSGATFERVATQNFAKVTNTTTAVGTVTMNDVVNSVASTVAGRTYTAKVRVRTSAPGLQLDLRMQQWGKTMTTEVKQRITPGQGWATAQVALTSPKGAESIDLNLVGYALPAGATYEVDLLSLTDSTNAEYVPDPEFAGSVTAFRIPARGSVAQVTDDQGAVNGPFGRLANSGAQAATVSVSGSTIAGPVSVPGTDYTASAKVRSSALAGQRVQLQVSEGADGPSSSREVVFNTAGWASVTTAHTAGTAGSPLAVRVQAPNLPSSATVDVDDVTLVALPNDAPVAAMAATPTDLTVAVDGSASADPDGTVASYKWDFGDGVDATGVTASHEYADAGDYVVRLTVTDNDGASAQTSQTVTVVAPNQPPEAAFTQSVQDLDLSVDAATSADPDGSVSSYAWDFGDGGTASGVSATHGYAQAGQYVVTLTIADNKGATDTVTKQVTTVKPNVKPTAAFAAPMTDLTLAADASASSDSDGQVVSYAWDFGDGSTGSGVKPSHSYAAAGTYPVALTVTDDRGGKDTVTKQVTAVKPNVNPTAAFTATPADLKVTVDAAGSADVDGTIASYAWAFGDGSTGNGATASRTYAAAGAYSVTLTVTDDDGATATATKQVTVTKATGLQLFWSDEFDGGSVNASWWKALDSNYGSGSGQIQCHKPKNATVSGGLLSITAMKEPITCGTNGSVSRAYSSGFLSSRDAGRYYPLYGRYEMRARIPQGQGIGAAFWLRHKNGASAAEVDIMETFHAQAPGTVTQTLHFPNTLGTNVAKATTKIESGKIDITGWHTYAVEITPAAADNSQVRFRYFVDDKLTKDWVNTNASSWTNGYANNAWDIAVSVPVGGAWWGSPENNLGFLSSDLIGGTSPNKCALTYSAPTNGPASCTTDKNKDGIADIWFAKFPATYQVDYVRVSTWQ